MRLRTSVTATTVLLGITILSACGSTETSNDGSAHVTGSVGGLSIPTAHAGAAWSLEPANGTVAVSVTISSSPLDYCSVPRSAATYFNLGLFPTTPGTIALGAYAIGTGQSGDAASDAIEAYATISLIGIDGLSQGGAKATDGTITLTLLAADRMRGTFDLSFPQGERLTGDFDAPVCNPGEAPDSGH